MIYSTRQRYGMYGGGTCLLLFTLLSVTAAQQRGTIDYALQVRPVTFPQEPTSRVALEGSSVTFNCNTSIAPLVSNYPLPTLTWRFNGSEDMSTQSSWTVTSKSGEAGYSELHIRNVTEGHAGYYECVSSDGKGRYVTVSRRAWLTVVKVKSVLGVQSRQLAAESPLLLPCDVGTSVSPEQAQWFRDGVPLSRDDLRGGWDILRDGSLLVFSASSEDAGSYHCTGWITGTPLNSSEFEITVTAGVGSAQLLVDPDRAQPTAGESLNLTCYFTGRLNGTEGQMRWLKNREVLVATNVTESGGRRAVLQLDGLAPSHSGVYTCEMMVDEMILQASAHVTVTVPPTISGERVLPDMGVRQFLDSSVVLSCTVAGSPTPTVHWYRNGQDITHLVSNGTMSMTYTVSDGNISKLLGIYQCFAVNSAGAAYNILRVLEYAFANPPGNLTCTLALRNNSHQYTGPWILLNWVPPVLSPFFPPSSYEILYKRFRVSSIYPQAFDEPHAELDFEDNGQGTYSLQVRVDRRNSIDPQLPFSHSCIIKTDSILSAENMKWPFSSVSCQDSNIAVKWLNPTTPIRYDYIEKLRLNATCLYGNKTDLKFSSIHIDEYDDYNEASYSLSPRSSVPSGAVCLFGGDFRFDEDPIPSSRIIPSEQCSLPAKQALNQTVRLGLSCQRSAATISWFTSPTECYRVQNLTLQGKCLDRAWPWAEFQYSVVNTTEPAGIATVDGIPNDAICTFYGYYQDSDEEMRTIDPVQCVMGQDVDPVYSLMQDAANFAYKESDCSPPTPEPSSELPTTSPALIGYSSPIAPSTTANPPSTTANPPSTPKIFSTPGTFPPTQPGGIRGYWWALVGAIGVVAAFVFIVAMLLLAIIYHNRRLIHKETEERLRMAQLVRQHCKEDPYEPSILMELRHYDGLDAASVMTDWENLCRPQNNMTVTEKSISSLVEDGKPHLMSKFLQSQPTTPAAWRDSGTNISNNQECDPHRTARLQPHEQTTEDSSLHVSHVPGSPEHVSITDNVEVAGHPFVSYSHSGGTCSSGYGTESYYTSDVSFCYNTSEGPNSLYMCKLDTLEEGLDATELRTDMLPTDPNNLISKQVNKRVRILSPDLKIDAREVCERVSKTSAQEIQSEQNEDTSPLFTGDSNTNIGHQKKEDPEIKQNVSHLASSPLSEISEDCSRSPHQSAYNTDDEGYVHMDCALPAATIK